MCARPWRVEQESEEHRRFNTGVIRDADNEIVVEGNEYDLSTLDLIARAPLAIMNLVSELRECRDELRRLWAEGHDDSPPHTGPKETCSHIWCRRMASLCGESK